MKVSVSWLREFVDFDWSPQELAERLEMTGTAVEAVERISSPLRNVVVGRIKAVKPHPSAERLLVASVAVKGRLLTIVCGARNIAPGDKVPVALVGAVLPGGGRIGRANLRGVASEGMLCSARELELGEDAGGILILEPEARVGEELKEFYGLDDVVIDFEVTPNRPDCMSMIGVAREVAALTRGRVRLPETAVREASLPAMSKAQVEVKDYDLCPRYSARVLAGLSVKESPVWMQQRLIKAGVRPINNVVDVTNYVMMETGQPLHAFDCERVRRGRIIVRRARKGEEMVTLDGVERSLSTDMLVIADPGGAIAVAGVMGGAATEIGEVTDRVLVESAYFGPRSIYHTANALDVRSESSSRFERGTDPNRTLYAAERAAALMQKLAGGVVLKGAIDVYPKRIRPKRLRLRVERTNEILGTTIPAKEMATILDRLELKVEPPGSRLPAPGSLRVTVPTFRPDLEREIDLVEEVARMHGYGRVKSTLPESSGKHGGLTERQKVTALIRDTLCEAGLLEAVNYSFIGQKDLDRVGLPKGSALRRTVKVKNPLSEEQNVLRPTLLPGLLKVLAFNAGYGVTDAHVFELGRVFTAGTREVLPTERLSVACAATGSWHDSEWYEKERDVDFYDAKGLTEALMARLGITDHDLRPARPAGFHPERAAEVIVGNDVVGVMGELHPTVGTAYGLAKAVVAVELDEDVLAEHASLAVMAVAPSRYPAMSYDVAVVVRRSVSAHAVETVIRKNGGPLLVGVHLFDMYEGKQVGKDKKSLAYRLTYQSRERTLLDKEVRKMTEGVVAALRRELGATIRR